MIGVEVSDDDNASVPLLRYQLEPNTRTLVASILYYYT